MTCPVPAHFADYSQAVREKIAEGLALLQDARSRPTQGEAGHEGGLKTAAGRWSDAATCFSEAVEAVESGEMGGGGNDSLAFAELLMLYGEALVGSAREALEQDAERMVLGPQVPSVVATGSREEDEEEEEEEEEEEAPPGKEEAPETDTTAEAEASTDEGQRAWEVLECARAVFESSGVVCTPRVIDCYEMLGDLSLYVNDAFEQAASDYAIGIALARQYYGQGSRRLGSLYHSRYVALRSANDWSGALEALEGAVRVFERRVHPTTADESVGDAHDEQRAVLRELRTERDAVREALARKEAAANTAGSNGHATTSSAHRAMADATLPTETAPDVVPVVPKRGVKREAPDAPHAPDTADEST